MRSVVFALSASLILGGCTADPQIRTYSEPIEGATGELVLKAVRKRDPGKLSANYSFYVGPVGGDPVWHTTRSDAPILLRELPPGTYVVVPGGRSVEPKEVRIPLREGERVTVELLTGGKGSAHRFWKGVDGTLAVVGSAFAVLIILAIYLVIEANDDEECRTDVSF